MDTLPPATSVCLQCLRTTRQTKKGATTCRYHAGAKSQQSWAPLDVCRTPHTNRTFQAMSQNRMRCDTTPRICNHRAQNARSLCALGYHSVMTPCRQCFSSHMTCDTDTEAKASLFKTCHIQHQPRHWSINTDGNTIMTLTSPCTHASMIRSPTHRHFMPDQQLLKHFVFFAHGGNPTFVLQAARTQL